MKKKSKFERFVYFLSKPSANALGKNRFKVRMKNKIKQAVDKLRVIFVRRKVGNFIFPATKQTNETNRIPLCAVFGFKDKITAF